jgi:phytoene/squalene synthetase
MLSTDTLRHHDRLRYLLALWLAAPEREDMMTLGAWHVEIVGSLRKVSEPMLGHIRLQWWRETMAALLSGKKIAHPLVDPLLQMVTRCAIPLTLLEAHIDACDEQFERSSATMAEYLEGVTESTCPLAAITSKVLGLAQEHEKIAQDLAAAYALLVDMLCLVYPEASSLPADMLLAYDQGDMAALDPCFTAINARISHLIPDGKTTRYLRLQSTLIKYYVQQLQTKCGQLRQYHYQRHYGGAMLRLGITRFLHG